MNQSEELFVNALTEVLHNHMNCEVTTRVVDNVVEASVRIKTRFDSPGGSRGYTIRVTEKLMYCHPGGVVKAAVYEAGTLVRALKRTLLEDAAPGVFKIYE